MTRNPTFILVIGLVITAYSLINYYIGLRGWQFVFKSLPWLNRKVYWIFFWFVAFSYLIGRMSKNYLPSFIDNLFTLIGAYWLVAFYYLLFVVVIIDIVRLIDFRLGFLPEALRSNGAVLGWMVIIAVAGLLIFGTWNARNPVVTHYDVNINKKAGNLRKLRIVMASDVHLGMIMDNKRLTQMIQMIKDLNPDIVLLPGDVIDESVEPYIEQKMADTFRQLQPPLGVYASLGNHEHIGESGEDVVAYLGEGGVKVLVDSYVKVADSFYVVGRDDTSHGTRQRKELEEILEGTDKSLPLILLDHNPSHLKEAQEQGIDLQVSGHTHRGQFFPNNFITERIYEIDHGHLIKGTYQLIVSNGFGTWGPPVRIGNRPEIVDITVNFSQ